MAMYMSMPPQDFRDDAGHCWGFTDLNSTPNASSATTGTAKRKLNRDKEHVFERNRDIFSISKSLRSIVGLSDDHNISLSTDCSQSTRSVKRHKPNHAESDFLECSNLDEPLNNNTLNKISSSNLKQQQQSMGFLSRNSSNYRDFLENSAEFKAYPEMSSMCGMDETAFGMIPTFSPSSTTITTTSPSAFHAPCPSCFHTPENERPSQNESLLPSLPATVSPTLFCNASYVNPLCNICSVPSPYSDSSDSAGEFSSPPYIQSSAVSPLDGIALGSITKGEEEQGDKMRGSMGRDSFHEYFDDDEQQSLDGNYTHKNIKQMSTVLSDLPGFDKVRWQSILQSTRSPEVGDREIQRRVKEAEIIGTRIFGGDTNKMFTSLMNQNLEFLLSYVCNLRNGKKRHKKLRQRLLKELQKED